GHQPDDGLVVLFLGLLDDGAGDELIKNLPHGHRRIVFDHLDDGIADCGDLGPGPARPFYRAWSIRFRLVSPAHRTSSFAFQSQTRTLRATLRLALRPVRLPKRNSVGLITA